MRDTQVFMQILEFKTENPNMKTKKETFKLESTQNFPVFSRGNMTISNDTAVCILLSAPSLLLQKNKGTPTQKVPMYSSSKSL